MSARNSHQVSVSCGIPDFRSEDGIYARLSKEYPDLPNPTAMFDMKFFLTNPKPFFQFARVTITPTIKPTIAHLTLPLYGYHLNILNV